ncbi:MAG TPA: response regulator [Phototrophicaceae bacterium]|jgi:DNA-binding response OmpR family regulator|nr:response regulator [Phototrophicaceae bacterium]
MVKDKVKVMIIEDEQDLLNLYKEFLKSKGYTVLVTNTTATHIMDDYLEFKPDIILLDYRLPGDKNGVDAAKEILEQYPEVPIMIITAYDSIKNIINGEKIFEGKKITLVVKPIKLLLLNKLIKELLDT